jgi:RNA polymerase sigma-70 factor (ECF subfamily)
MLVERARAGDASAFATLHASFAPMVHGVLLSIVGPHDAEDLMQEVFVTAWRNIASVREAEHVGAWLATIARNRGKRFRARSRETANLPDDAAAPARDGAPTDGGREILDVLLAIPETYRETLVMRLVEGLTGPEIAERTGLTHGSVRVNLTRGMKLLRDALERKGLS